MSKQKNKNNRDQYQKNTPQHMRSLRTAQEEQLEDVAFSTPFKTPKNKPSLNVTHNFDEEEEQMLNVSVGELKDTSTDKITAAISELIAKNKISAKNAFDVPMIHLKQTKEYNSLNGDNNWKKISSTLDSNNKIYGYRVDATHNYTYKVLQLLTRQEKQNKNIKEEQEVQREEPQTNFLQFQNQEHAGDEVLFKYLQKNYKGINIIHLQVFFNVNPILEKTKRIFDQQGLRGLLLNNIEISKNLLLKLSCQPSNEQQTYNQQQFYNNNEVQLGQESSCDEVLRSENIFSQIYNICYLNDLIEKEAGDGQFVKREDNDNEIDMMWKQLESLAQTNPKSSGNQHLIDLNQEFTNPQEQHNYQNEECSRQPEINIQKVQKQTYNITDLPLEITQSNSPIKQINDQNLKQPTQMESAIQVATEGIAVNIENAQTNKDKAEAVSDEQKEPISPHKCSNKPFLIQISHIKSDNTPLVSEFQLTKASNFTDPLCTVPRNVPISQFIRLSKKLNDSQLFLKQIQAGEEHDKDENQVDIVDKWKNGDKKAKAPRKPKKCVQKRKEQIEFLLDQSYSGRKLRQKVLKIQKVRKLELKKFMKELKTERIFENYLNIDTSRYKFDFKFTTFYREDQPLSSQQIESPNTDQPQPLLFQTNMLCNQSSYIDLIDQNSSNQTKTVSLKYVKHKLHSFIFDQKLDSFTDIYFNFINSEGYITPALCFLTVLHLTYQQTLRLQAENEDIKIFHGGPPNSE